MLLASNGNDVAEQPMTCLWPIDAALGSGWRVPSISFGGASFAGHRPDPHTCLGFVICSLVQFMLFVQSETVFNLLVAVALAATACGRTYGRWYLT